MLGTYLAERLRSMLRLLWLYIPFLLQVVAATPSLAQTFVPRGQCAVVVASRPTVDAAKQYVWANSLESVARIFESSNGWFAITTGMISNAGSADVILGLKRSGTVPSDAYCSTGGPYIREVAWRPEARDPDGPISVGLWSEFDARPLTREEKRFLQAALAMEGYYNGLLDGSWGNRSQSALESYTSSEFEGVEPTNAHAAYLTSIMLDRWVDEGWDYIHIRHLGISMMLPVDELRLIEDNGPYEEWSHRSKDLVVMFNDLRNQELAKLHSATVSGNDLIREPYRLRSARTWVSSVMTTSGTVYARSDLVSGSWSTVVLMAGHSLEAEVGLIAGSIRPGMPVKIVPPENGVLWSYTEELVVALRESDRQQNQYTADRAGSALSSPPQTSDDPSQGISSGTAFFVTDNGYALTNAHVVDGCHSIQLDGMSAEIVAISSAFDLAAVRLVNSRKTAPLVFSDSDAELNSDITIAGFPLYGLLGGLNIGRGSISSMKGLRGDEVTIQISAPVQPGNSGGPVIDRYGSVVGVVVSKLDAIRLAEATGDIAQNINFAIRGSIAKVFLSSNGIGFGEFDGSAPVSPEEAADLLLQSTTLLECSR